MIPVGQGRNRHIDLIQSGSREPGEGDRRGNATDGDARIVVQGRRGLNYNAWRYNRIGWTEPRTVERQNVAWFSRLGASNNCSVGTYRSDVILR